MAEQVLIQFRADKKLKQEVADIYEQLGIDLPTAFRMFMKRSKQVRGIPFELTLPEETVTKSEALDEIVQEQQEKTYKSARGILSKYANNTFVDEEKTAWEKAAKEN